MDADEIRGLKPMLTRYLNWFDDCFARRDAPALIEHTATTGNNATPPQATTQEAT